MIQGVITSLIGGLIGYFFRQLLDWFFLFRKSPYSGTWEDEIMNSNEEIEKRDTYQIKHNRRTNEIKGTISRYQPVDQNHRKWKMVGKIDGNYIIFSFWSEISTHKSHGCVYLKHAEDNVFEGYYLEDHKDGKIDKTHIRLKKKD